MRFVRRRFRKACDGERGALLIEAVVAITVLVLAGTGVLAAVSTSDKVATGIQESAVAENIGRNQMETLLAGPYEAPPYTYSGIDLISTPAGYGVTATTQYLSSGTGLSTNSNFEAIVVQVTRNGSTVLTIETYREAS